MICAIASLGLGLGSAPSFASSSSYQSEPASTSLQASVWLNPDYAIGWIITSDTSDGYGVIYKTVDGGLNWERQGSPEEIPDAPLYGVYAIDSKNVWVAGGTVDGYGLILRTTDGGDTWARQGSVAQVPDVELNRVYALDNQTAWVSGEQGVMLYTDNGGQIWARKGQGTLPEVHLEGIYASDANHAWVVATDEPSLLGMIFHTNDGGQTWEKQFEKPSHWMISIHGVDANTAWAVGNDTVVNTIDGGQSWQDQKPPTGPYDFNGIYALDHDRVWTTNDNDSIYLSINGGGDWTLQSPPRTGFYLIRVSPIDARSAWIIGPAYSTGEDLGIILRTSDGGEHWVEQHAPTDESWSGVDFVPVWTYYFPWVAADR